jgi:hypothetical protein
VVVALLKDDFSQAKKILEAEAQALPDRIPTVRGNILGPNALRFWAETFFPDNDSASFPDVDSATVPARPALCWRR